MRFGCFLGLVVCTFGAPFVSTWNTTIANQTIEWPTVLAETAVTIDWGDNSPSTTVAAGDNATDLNHTYATKGSHNISLSGRFRWAIPNPLASYVMVDIVSWGDGFVIDGTLKGVNPLLYFSVFPKIRRISAPANTQPVFLPGATLSSMFAASNFDSPLDWDLANVTSLSWMFFGTPLNSPITFRNTQGVTTMAHMFESATLFNQPINFDASSVTSMGYMFLKCIRFNSPITLTNSRKVTTMNSMFYNASVFNQPLSLNTDSVTDMTDMFHYAAKFNQPVNFNTTQVNTTLSMFEEALDFNQPITFISPGLNDARSMFQGARSFNKPVMIDSPRLSMTSNMFLNAVSFTSTVNFTSTSRLWVVDNMFAGAPWFEQDLSGWNVSGVMGCDGFCEWCGLPNFTLCTPCNTTYAAPNGMRICQNGTHTPTPAPSTGAPSVAPTASSSPSVAPPAMSAGTSVAAAPIVLALIAACMA